MQQLDSLPPQTSPQSPELVYQLVVRSYALGIGRLTSARIAALTAQVALAKVHAPDFPDASEDEQGKVIAELKAVSYTEFDSFTYVQDISYLVYATSLLDCFLAETSRFLLLMFPGAMGKKQSITVDVILAASTREELLTAAVSKKVRELGYLSFLDRVAFLSTQFGLPINLGDSTVKALEHYSNLRNVVIHDQNVFETVLVPGGLLQGRRKTCPQHPTPVVGEDLKRAATAYHEVVGAVYYAVLRHVFKKTPDDDLAWLLKLVPGPSAASETEASSPAADAGGEHTATPNKPLQPTSGEEIASE